MPRVSATIEGGGELIAELRRMGLDVTQALEVAAHVGAQVFVSAADERAPAPLIMAKTTSKRKTRVSVDVGPPDEKWYWRFIEKGAQPHEIVGSPYVAFWGEEGLMFTGSVDHPGTPAKPFLRPAFDSNTGRATDAVGEKIKVTVLP